MTDTDKKIEALALEYIVKFKQLTELERDWISKDFKSGAKAGIKLERERTSVAITESFTAIRDLIARYNTLIELENIEGIDKIEEKNVVALQRLRKVRKAEGSGE